MAQIIKEIRVDVSQPNVFQAIVAKQNDCNSRFLKVTLTDYGTKINVEKTAKVTINANRPDGESQSFVGVANDDSTVTVPLAQWMLEVAGLLKCDVSVINTTDNKRLTSTDFFVNVQEAANKNTDISENPDGEFRVITPTQEINADSTDDQYPSAKAVYDLDNITATATGSAITVDSSQAPLQNLKLYGKTTQNGTPTPDNPIELKSVGDRGSFRTEINNKNLIDTSSIATQTNKGVTFTNNGNGSITVNGTATENASLNLVTLINFNGGDYLLSGGKGSENVNLYASYYDENFSWLSESWSTSGEHPLHNKKYGITIISVFVKKGATCNNVTIYPMLRHKSYNSDFEKGNKQVLTTPYTLRSVGDIKDEVDFNRGVLTEKMYELTVSKLTFEANLGTHSRFVCGTGGVGVNANYFSKTRNTHTPFGSEYTGDYAHAYVNGGWFYIFLPNDIAQSQSEIDEWLTSNSIKVVFVRATPIETPLTETELNAYRQLHTNKPNTTILSEADMEVEYYINKPNAQAIGNIHSQINKDYLKLQQAIISTGGNV